MAYQVGLAERFDATRLSHLQETCASMSVVSLYLAKA
jgi:hypothetical protein